MHDFWVWVDGHQAVAIFVLGAVLNSITGVAKMHKATSKFWLFIDATIGAWAPADVDGFVRKMAQLFGGGGSKPDGGSGADKARRPYDPEMTPTSPSRVVKRTSLLLAGVVLVGCLALRDAVTFTADGAKCVLAHTDKGETVEQALVPCGIEETPEAIKFFADRVAEHKAAARAAACWAPDTDAGAK